VFWRTITAGAWGHGEECEMQNDSPIPENFLTGPMEFDVDGHEADDYIKRAVSHATGGKGLSTTELKQPGMGLGPTTAEKGDLICVMLGCLVPVALRACKHGLDDTGEEIPYYHFVEECYVDGIMDGETMEKLDVGEYELQEFNII
jgi:hypothetical protein